MARLSNGMPTGHGWPEWAYQDMVFCLIATIIVLMIGVFAFYCDIVLGIIWVGIIVLAWNWIINRLEEVDRLELQKLYEDWDEDLEKREKERLDAIEMNRRLHGDYW